MARTIQSGPKGKAVGAMVVAPRLGKTGAVTSVQKQKVERVGVSQNVETVQNNVKVRQESAVQLKQSQELVQIMLNASIGSLFYLRWDRSNGPAEFRLISIHRGFLPLTCFDTRYLETKSNASISYKDFIEQDSNSKVSTKSQPLRILLRNRGPTADAILDLLEHGVFDAIDKCVLEAVQLTISRERDNPLHILESYTFSFAYRLNDKDKTGNLASVSLDNGECIMEMGTFRTAKMGLEMIIRRLITLTKRFLHVHLMYTEDCPPTYEPPGFKSTAVEEISFPRIENWTKETQSCGVMHGPHHSVSLKVTSLQWSGVGDDQIPDSLEYSDGTSRECDIGIDQPAEAQAETPGSPRDYPEELPHESTQIRKDVADRRFLQQMLEPSSVDTSMDPTQKVFYSDAGAVLKPQLSQNKATEIARERNQSPRAHLLQPTNSDAVPVRCQCGWNREEGDMVSSV
ncbi:predicted protein [Uncinocarpus reesii 1704]|uniref:HORMA domain-containing protein n=1 Tax=Uncinocarpus reesii (strain UAMH 1704) TaxID=336963 RepID=C4JSG3_UNCRE|nr:uncharacterized protein UREG_05402 [Uncinocarpus reesii 1704]EEP80560.1 predicted protein [Uncinocarpus reesii 1704]